MKLNKFNLTGLLISILAGQHAYADTLVYQCKMKNGKFNFTDEPCNKEQKTVSSRIIKPLAETHTVTPKYVPTETRIVYPRYESNELIESQRRKEAERDNAWNSLPPLGVTPYKSPGTYGYTRFAQH